MKQQATIRDVSRLANVSTATVSRALNNPELVKEATRERIQAAIDSLSYSSNALAASLKSGTSGVIGYIIPNMQIKYYNEIFDIMDRQLDEMGYSLLVATHNNSPTQEMKAVKKLLEYKVDALVVATATDDASMYEKIDRTDCPVVLIDRKLGTANLNMVSENCEETSYQLMRHVLSCGHRDILILTCLTHLSIMQERLDGCMRAVREAGLDASHIRCLDNEARVHSVRANLKEYLAAIPREQLPTAVISLNPRMTEGALLALRDMDIRVPDAVSVASFGGLNTELIQPALTCVVQNGELIGQKTVQILKDCLDKGRGEAAHTNIIVNDELCIADTVREVGAAI